jgi:mRNA interferase MazF
VRAIVIAELDKQRPAVILTREAVLPRIGNVTVAPITTTIRGLSTEVEVGPENGIDDDSVISCDNIVTIPQDKILHQVGYLLAHQEALLVEAINQAFDLYP